MKRSSLRRGIVRRPSSSRRTTLHGRRSAIELLEDRRVLAADLPHVLAHIDGSALLRDELQVEVRTEDFNLPGGEVALGFLVESSDAGFDPLPVTLRNASGQAVPPLAASQDVVGGFESMAIFRLGLGTYTVDVVTAAEEMPYRLSTFLAGDLDGDLDVDGHDLLDALLGLGKTGADLSASGDVDSNGIVNRADLRLLRDSLGARTTIGSTPLALAAHVGGQTFASSFAVFDDVPWTLRGTTTPGSTVDLDTNADGNTDLTSTASAEGDFEFELSFPNTGRRSLHVSASGALGIFDTATFTVNVQESFRLSEVSPAAGEGMVAPTRQAVVRFTEAVDPATVTTDSVQFIALGQPVPGSFRVSSTGMFATFIPDAPWPASTEVRIRVDGSQIEAANGDRLDADANGSSGGTRSADFRTVPSTLIPNTLVQGRVVASEPDAEGNDAPLGGVTIRVDGFPNLYAVTDEEGNFTLGLDPETGEPVGLPSPEYYVHIDGSTVTTVGGQPIPPGGAYPNVGKRFPSIPGQTLVKPFDVYLPFIPDEAIHAVTPDEEMKIHLPQSQIDEDPMLAMVELTLPPGSLIADDGTPGTQIGIYRVDSARLPAPLPDGLNHSFDITVQADVANFDVPAPITFPNMDGLAPGEQALLMSFDHARSEWVVVGTMTVSEDGQSLTSDPGVGIRAPGWHGVQPGAQQTRITTPQPMGGTTFEGGLDVQGSWDPPELFFDANFSFPVLGSETFNLESDFFDPIPIAFRRATTFFVPSPFDRLIPAPLREALFSADFQASLVLSVGVEVGVVASSGSSSVHFQLTLTPPSATIESSVTISNSPVCGVPVVGSIVCTTHQLPTIPLVGSGKVSLPSQSISLPAPLSADEAMQLNQFMATATVNAGITTKLSITPIAFLDIVNGSSSPARGVPSNEQPDIIFSPEDFNIDDFSTRQSVGVDDRAFYRYSFPSGFSISGVSNETGVFEVVLPPDTPYNLVVYQPSNNTSLVTTGVSRASGSSETLSAPLVDFGGIDFDGDGLPDYGELAIGTALDARDTDGDGISDGAEIKQGLDPLDGVGFSARGLIGSVALSGEAKSIAVEGSTIEGGGQRAYVATGSNGLAIVDASQFNLPIALGQIDLPGDATDVGVAPNLQIAAIAANTGGLHLIDVSDPMIPVLIRTVSLNATNVEIVDGVAYAAAGSALWAIDLITGEVLQSLSLGASNISGIAREGLMLYTMAADRTLRAIDISGFGMTARRSLQLPDGGSKLFVGNGIAYATANDAEGGYATADISDPDNLVLISGSDVPAGINVPKAGVALNGSGLGLLVGPAAGTNSFTLMDVSDPQNTNDFVTSFDLSGTANDVAIASGIAFVASTSGLQVVNYRPFDNQRQAPTVEVSTPNADIDPDAPGIQVITGTSVSVVATIADDVQVRNAELIVNGQVVANDVSFPFDFTAIARPVSAEDMTATIQVRATDTGGNTMTSDALVLQLLPDTIGPSIVAIAPGPTEVVIGGARTVRVRFSESMDRASLTTNAFELRDHNGDVVRPIDLQIRNDDTVVQITYPEFALGKHEVIVRSPLLTDRAGNRMDADDILRRFEVLSAGAFRIGSSGGEGADGLTTDAIGNIYLAGTFGGTVDFDRGPEVFELAGGGGFVVKYTASGSLAWAHKISGSIVAQSVGVDKDANVYVSGYAPRDIFVVKLDSDGNVLWDRRMPWSGNPASNYGLGIDDAGNVYTSGVFYGTVDFDPGPDDFPLSSAGDGDIYILKLDPQGNFGWARRVGAGGQDTSYGLAVGSDGTIYASGNFGGTVDFDPGTAAHDVASAGGRDGFLLKLDSSGDFEWVKTAGGGSDDVFWSVTLDGDSIAYVAGTIGGVDLPSPSTRAVLLRLDDNDNLVTFAEIPGVTAKGIASSNAGEIVLAGYFANTIDVDPGEGQVSRTSSGGVDAIVVKINPSGDLHWAAAYGGSADDFLRAITVDSTGNVFATGSFQLTADFGPGAAALNLRSAGGHDIFLARLGADPTEHASRAWPIRANLVYEYDPSLGTLPEDQGFTRTESGAPPTPIVDNGVLHQFPGTGNDVQRWELDSVNIDFADTSIVLEADLHVIASNYIPSLQNSGQRSGYYLIANDRAGRGLYVGIASDGITINTDRELFAGNGVRFTPFDATDRFHTYRLVIDAGAATLFIDNNFFASTVLGGPVLTDPDALNRVMFGDASGAGISETELRSLKFVADAETSEFAINPFRALARDSSGANSIPAMLILDEASEPNPAHLTGDVNGTATVEQADLDLVLSNWGKPATPPGWLSSPTTGNIDQNELDAVLSNWGRTAEADEPAVAVRAVPIPLALARSSAAKAANAFARDGDATFPKRRLALAVFSNISAKLLDDAVFAESQDWLPTSRLSQILV